MRNVTTGSRNGDNPPSPLPPNLHAYFLGRVDDGVPDGYFICADKQLKLVVTSKNRQTDRFVGKIREFFDTVFDAYSPAQVPFRL